MDEQERTEPFLISFGIKSTEEVELDGVIGLKTVGYASKFDVVDQDGEFQVPGSFDDIGDTWGRQEKPLVLYNHGMDPVMTTSPIGWGLNYKIDKNGLLAETFIPREPQPPLQDPARRKRYAEIYNGIKSKRIRGYSVGGVFKRIKNALIQWSMTELTITPTPCLNAATFGLGTKAVKSMIDNPGGFADPSIAALPAVGQIPMADWSQIMNTAQQAHDHDLHDYLLNTYATHHQGEHSAKSCAVCTDRRGGKAADAGPDSDYLVTSDGEQHLRVKKDGTPDHGLMGAAYAALTSNHRGQPYEGPDKAGALGKLRSLYSAEGMDWPGEKGGKASMCAACTDEGAGCKDCTCAGCKSGGACDCAALDDDNGDTGMGDKAILDALQTLRVFSQGVKAGRRFSKSSTDKVGQIIQMLHDMIDMQHQDIKDDKDTQDEEQGEATGDKCM